MKAIYYAYDFQNLSKLVTPIKIIKTGKDGQRLMMILSFVFKRDCFESGERMSHDHICIPKFIERGFSNDGKVYCYNLLNVIKLQ